MDLNGSGRCGKDRALSVESEAAGPDSDEGEGNWDGDVILSDSTTDGSDYEWSPTSVTWDGAPPPL